MKKLFIIVCLLIPTSLICFSQIESCQERTAKLSESIGALSAGMLCNTYRVICSNSEGLIGNIYTVATVNDRMNFQMGLINISIKRLTNLVNEDILSDGSDITYVNTAIQIFNGLYKQAQLLLDYAANKSKEKMDAFTAQRNTNWAGISKLLGFKE